MRTLAFGLVAALVLFSAGCLSSVPQYVRGDVAARSYEPIPGGASYAILKEHVRTPEERDLASRLDGLLRRFGLQPAGDGEPDLLIDFSHTVWLDDPPRAAFWDPGRALLDAPDSRRRRFAVEVQRGTGASGEPRLAWRGEVQSDGADRSSAVLGDSFLRLALSHFNRTRELESFSFRVDGAALAARSQTQSRARGMSSAARPARAPAPAPRATAPVLDLSGSSAPVVQAPSPDESAPLAPLRVEASAPAKPPEVPTPRVEPRPAPPPDPPSASEPAPPAPEASREPAVGREPGTLFGALFGSRPERAPARATEPAPQRTRTAPANRTTPPQRVQAEPVAPAPPTPRNGPRATHAPATAEAPDIAEYAEVGPTWRDAVAACEALTARGDVECSVFVEVATSAPYLELKYATAEHAKATWAADAASAGASFCVSAARHGLYGKARIVIYGGEASASRRCKEIAR